MNCASGRINSLVATLLFSKLSSTIFKALGFGLFLICTMLVIQGLFTVGIKLCCFLCLGCRSTKRPDLRHHTGLSVLVIILTSDENLATTTMISENAAYLELSGLSYKTVYVLMSVCYILPEMMRNMRKKIQQAQKVPGTIRKKR